MLQIGERHLRIIDTYILPVVFQTTAKILFTKLRADIFRYLAEAGLFCSDGLKESYKQKAEYEYQVAEQYCEFESDFLN